MSTSALTLKPGTVLATDAVEPVLIRMWVTEGSYAHIYQGAYGRDGVPCAVKVPKVQVDAAVELVRIQGEILTRVRGPHVIRLLDRGTAVGLPFLVLEWLEGGTLLDLVRSRRRLPLRQSLEILEQLAVALSAFHQAKQPHGDIRAENVVLEGRGAVLIDPHGLPVGNVAPPSAAADLEAAAGLFHLMLTGERYDAAHSRLSPAAGYRRDAVQLWERLRSGLLTASELAEQTRTLRKSL